MSMGFLFFLLKVFVISLSGVLQPGPVTATTISLGAKNRYAGLQMALGHGIVELPLMVLILFGLDKLFRLDVFKISVGFIGGLLLIYMAYGMYMESKKETHTDSGSLNKKPVLAGIVLSAANPYFLLWWATVGLKLTMDLKDFTIWAFPVFALLHWLCDAGWLVFLSWASFKGADVLGPKGFDKILSVCAILMVFFGISFLFDSLVSLKALL